MTEKSASPVAAAEEKTVTKMETAIKKGGASKSVAKPRVKPNHPSTADMVKSAIKTLADRGGSSLQAIKKYITATYKIDSEKQAPFIKKYLKAAVTAGTLVQTKGKGASGSFKLAVIKSDAPKSKPKSSGAKKTVKPKKPTSPKKAPLKKADATKVATKKPTSPKKTAVKKNVGEKKSAVKSSAGTKIAKPKSPSKTKKAVKAPTSKPKAPKPKKVASPKVAKPAATKKPAASKK